MSSGVCSPGDSRGPSRRPGGARVSVHSWPGAATPSAHPEVPVTGDSSGTESRDTCRQVLSALEPGCLGASSVVRVHSAKLETPATQSNASLGVAGRALYRWGGSPQLIAVTEMTPCDSGRPPHISRCMYTCALDATPPSPRGHSGLEGRSLGTPSFSSPRTFRPVRFVDQGGGLCKSLF